MIILFDVDSTLVNGEWLVALAKRKWLTSSFNEITERAMDGEIDFHTSFTKRLEMLQVTPEDETRLGEYYLWQIVSWMEDLIHHLVQQGHHVGCLTFSLQWAAEILAQHLWMKKDLVFGNQIYTPYGMSDILEKKDLLIYDESKGKRIQQVKEKRWMKLCFVGDGYQDMLSGMKYADTFIWAGYVTSREKVKKGARYFAEDIQQLANLLEAHCGEKEQTKHILQWMGKRKAIYSL